jgi:serine/threonine protein kinase
MVNLYLGRDRRDGQHVVLKAVIGRPSKFLIREFEILRGLRHPNIVRAHDWFELDGRSYFAMEQVEGASSLLDCLRPHQGRFDEYVAAIFRQLMDGLDYVHSKNIVHYGLSPRHILLDADGHLRIVDFGLARRLGMDESDYWPPGSIAGVPAYMSPEHLQGHACLESDYFVIGTLLVEHLAGRNPFIVSDGIPGILGAVANVNSEAMLSQLSGIPDSLAAVVRLLLHREAEPRREGWALFRELVEEAKGKGTATVGAEESRQQFLVHSQADLGMLSTLSHENEPTSQKRQIEDLFIRVMSLDLRHRASFLERECAGDQELLNEVAELLAAHEQASEHSQLPPLVPDRWSSDANLLEPGAMVGKYRVVGKVGKGGMGEVYAVHNDELNRPAAIKLMRSDLSQSDQSTRRFINEARAAASIRHPGIVDIIDVDRLDNGCLYILMELLEGESLSAYLKRAGALPEVTAIALLRQAADALAAAHQKGIVHRDLKPENMFLVPDTLVPGGNRLKLLDFGIAKLIEDSTLTQSGAVMGTPPYMSPEQCHNAKSADQRSDLYSLGIMLFEMLCGRLPFIRESRLEYLIAHVNEEPPLVKKYNPSVSDSIAAITTRLLAKNPDDRYSSARGLIAALDQAAPGPDLHGSSIGYLITQPEMIPQPVAHASHIQRAASGLYDTDESPCHDFSMRERSAMLRALETSGQRVGPYVLREFLGAGGSGLAFRAVHAATGRELCVKVFYPLLMASEMGSVLSVIAQAVRALTVIDHPSIVKVFDFGDFAFEDGQRSCYLAMELVRGRPLDEWSRQLSSTNALGMRIQMAHALACAFHAAHTCRYLSGVGIETIGLLHGDIKPANILVRDDDTPVVVDFLLVDVQRRVQRSGLGELYETMELGTPIFMAPEQARDGIITVRTDIYSLGVTYRNLFFPDDQKNNQDKLQEALRELLHAMMANRLDARPESMRDVGAMLKSIAQRFEISLAEGGREREPRYS